VEASRVLDEEVTFLVDDPGMGLRHGGFRERDVVLGGAAEGV